MRARISIIGDDISCSLEPLRDSGDIRIELTNETLSMLGDWAGQYARAVQSGDPSLLLVLGSEMFTWLDGSGWASKWASGTGDRTLEVAVDDTGSKAAGALLDLPWETLAYKGDFLAADPNQAFQHYLPKHWRERRRAAYAAGVP